MVKEMESTREEQLLRILENPEKKILPLLYGSTNPEDQQDRQKTQAELVDIVKHLFSKIERTAQTYHHVTNSSTNEEQSGGGSNLDDIPPLSGLSEVYVPQIDGDGENALDVETLWGQIELQNMALNKLLRKSTRKLAKSPKDIVVLDMGQLSSDDEDDDNSNDDEDSDLHQKSEDEDNMESTDDAEEDEDAQRIRKRMERALDDMESDEDEDEANIPSQSISSSKMETKKKEEDLFDPIAEEMKDGFFDLNDMEDYADEEEDFLPQEAFGTTEEEKNRSRDKQEKKSFHQMQRDGELHNRSDDDDDDDDDDAFEDMYEENRGPVKRNKYRDDEDIEALYSMYQSTSNSDQKAEDAANLTAVEFFGQPSKKYMEKYNAKKAKDEIKGDDDSWGEYDFEDEEARDSKRSIEKENENKTELSEDDEYDEEDGEGNQELANKIKEASHTDHSSQHGKRQEKLKKQTEELENEMLSEKPWQMTGETKSTTRPVNSLLEGTPEFEMASKQAPAITVEHTTNLEDVIKKRIIDEDWDDVVPRELPDVGWHKKRGELPEVSQEKSKLGLGELYEREYLKKAVGYDKDVEEKKTAEDKAKDEMKQLFANLCSKLDGLSNYHFAPRPVADEAELRTSSTPAIAMEEVLPLHVNEARGVAPEEVYATKRGREGVLRGETEMDQQERKRLRQSKKASRRKARKEKLADDKLISRLQPGLGLNNPYEKRKMQEELSMARSKGRVTTGEQDMDGKYGSSGTFFKRLQAEAQQTIRGADVTGEEKQKKKKPKSSSLKM